MLSYLIVLVYNLAEFSLVIAEHAKRVGGFILSFWRCRCRVCSRRSRHRARGLSLCSSRTSMNAFISTCISKKIVHSLSTVFSVIVKSCSSVLFLFMQTAAETRRAEAMCLEILKGKPNTTMFVWLFWAMLVNTRVSMWLRQGVNVVERSGAFCQGCLNPPGSFAGPSASQE